MPEQVDTLRLNPAQALYIQLDDISLTMQEVLRELRHRPTGHIMPLTGIATEIVVVHKITPAWFSLVITNDGPDPLEFLIGEVNQDYVVLNPRETMPVDFDGTLIRGIRLKTAPDQQANFRIFGVY